MFGIDVRATRFTRMWPLSLSWTPASSRPMSDVFGTAPTAMRQWLPRTSRPSVSVATTESPSRTTDSARDLFRTFMPLRLKTFSMTDAASASSPGSTWSRLEMSVTLAPSARYADAASVIEKVFKRNGMKVMNKSRAESVVRDGDSVVATLTDGREVRGSHCLMAVGSVPNTADIGLEEAGVQLSESGHIRVNRVARTSMPNIYAAGDCTTFLPLASVASMQGRTAVFHAMGDIVDPPEERNITSNIFTQPEIATVGWTQKDIEEGVVPGVVYKLPLASNPRAKMMGIRDGFVKLFASNGSGAIIGGVIVAPKASELILPLALAVEHRLTVDQFAEAFPIYPSLTGSLTDAARAMHVVR